MAAQGWKALPAAFCISQSFSQQNPSTSGQFLHSGGDLFRQCFGIKTNRWFLSSCAPATVLPGRVSQVLCGVSDVGVG